MQPVQCGHLFRWPFCELYAVLRRKRKHFRSIFMREMRSGQVCRRERKQLVRVLRRGHFFSGFSPRVHAVLRRKRKHLGSIFMRGV